MMASLEKGGWIRAESPDSADVIIVNSCAFINAAKQESLNAVLSHRKAYPGKKIILAGCLAQRYGTRLEKSLPEADLLLNTEELERVINVLGTSSGREKGKRPLLSPPGSAYVKISEGCSNWCTFCAIPLIKGELQSRTIPDIVAECLGLLDRGIHEICLVGQDVASFGMDREGGELYQLLMTLLKIQRKFWIRLLYIHPDHFPYNILKLFQKDPRLVPYFDLPFQHSARNILNEMNRHGNANTYLKLLEDIRGALPNAIIRSTFLVGFPGETEADFRSLLRFQQNAELDWMGCFCYSREEGTLSYKMNRQVAKRVAAERQSILENHQVPITEKHLNHFIGHTIDVLVEESLSRVLYLGRIFAQAPEVDGATVIHSNNPLVPGTVVQGTVYTRLGFDLQVSVNN
ncbi:ribosomal protein S12 methylthiotransferase RimO [Spirochaetia bacterium]|nr:ribosomal protein S12 methylthiotransferase RimO [Spirochaetia bacterium]GHU29729.1 ribosomal protein S12 methylthiotransferase RimO [Spirochaetia bacterium]